ncbi:MAG: hypothetical protein ACYC3A_07110 [Halothiobacillus sp.]
MWPLFQNNPAMIAMIIVIVMVVIALHVGIYVVIRRLIRRDLAASTRNQDG